MVSLLDGLGLLAILGINTALAALLTRFFRVRLNTRWGALLYAVALSPVALVVVTMVLGSVVGPDLGSPAAVVGVTVLLPMAAGLAFDYFWMPSPEEVDLPERSQRG